MRTRWSRQALTLIVVAFSLAVGIAPAAAEQAGSTVRNFQAGLLDAGGDHTCAVTTTGGVRCWGEGSLGVLGYGNENDIGDDEAPSTVGDVPLGGTATAVSAGIDHTCALMTTGAVRCWGDGNLGKLGYGNENDIGDDEAPSTAGDVPLGGTATAIAAGTSHTCAILTTGAVRCWGSGSLGRLGYGNTATIGNDEPASAAGDVPLGGTAKAISATGAATCALLTTGAVRCWGFGEQGRLGYGNTDTIGDNETPASVGDVPLGKTASAIGVGNGFACAIVTGDAVRCWGFGAFGALGRGSTANVGDDETPASVGDVPLGGAATAISVGVEHVCALGPVGEVRCWGAGSDGRLGYGSTTNIGDNETAASAGVVPVGSTASMVAGGYFHTCALILSGDVRCWGRGAEGQLGTASVATIGDGEPASAGGLVSLGAKLHGRVADVSVSLTAPVTATAGTPYPVVVTVRNDGPDPISSATVTTAKLAGVPSQGGYDAATGTWAVGGLASGTDAVLTLTDPAGATGSRVHVAELTSGDGLDLDSVPGNSLVGEDDRATAITQVSAATPGTPQTPPPSPPVTNAPPPVLAPPASAPLASTPPAVTPPSPDPRVRGRLSLVAKPRPGSRRIKVTGKLVLPAGTSRTACTGRVTLRLKRGRTTLATTRASLKRPRRGRTCTITGTLRPKTAVRALQKLKITASLRQTTRLRPVTRTITKTVPRR